jgi:hypothetical protein
MQTHFTSQNVQKSSSSIPIRAGGHVVGKVKQDKFIKTVDGSRHFLRVPPAICFDMKSLLDAERAGAVTVEVIDRETGRVYRATIQLVWDIGFKVSRGFGDQIALPFNLWQVAGDPLQLALL